MVNDQISDMLTKIRNANLAKHNFTLVTHTKLNLALLSVLQAEGYIKNYTVESFEFNKLKIKVFLSYKGWWIKKPVFSILKRISKPGHRVFSSYKKFNTSISTLHYQQGIAIISTSIGIMSHNKAVIMKQGGEILCYIE